LAKVGLAVRARDLLTAVRPSEIFTHKDEYFMSAVHLNLDRTLVALADPTRRAILQRLSKGEARVTDLAAPFDISLNSVSKHIRMLERARLVKRRRVGREHILSFNPKPLDETAAWIESQRHAWKTRLDALGALLEEEDRAAAAAPNKRGRSR
jgi:DNA-binding transcriptional ArsR family regulator